MPKPQSYYGRAYRVVKTWGNGPIRGAGNPTSDNGLTIWREVDKEAWNDLVCAGLVVGALTSISTSSDGGVLHTFILHNGWRYDHYAAEQWAALECWEKWGGELNRYGCILRPEKGMR